ncbi:MAG TPA: hypothetical protein VGF28_07240 [Thermoanaerobaculia bacterium]|jgi:hypothetical protein
MRFSSALSLLLFLFLAPVSSGGGAWVPAPGEGDLQLGFSRKTANTSWNAFGDAFNNTTTFEGQTVSHNHDFRYVYLSGEIGVVDRLSARFLVTHLNGLEGPRQHLEENNGWSDAWVGLKYGITRGSWPTAIAATVRTPILYDLPGAYNRYLFDAEGNRRGVSPEWRGVLKHDYTVSYLVSHSFSDSRAWASAEAGYTWREGAPADQIPLSIELGLPVWRNLTMKATVNGVRSLGNDSPSRPDDRFRARPDFNFNDASMVRAGVALMVPVRGSMGVEVGYNQWLGGESARRYREPYVSLGYGF